VGATVSAAILQFRVVGLPVTQGSKRAVLRGKRAGMIDANDAKLRPWREAVRAVATDTWGNRPPTAGPVRVLLLFALNKPASAPKTRRTWPMGARSGDVDKLARAVLDAMTDAGIWRDDAQVVRLEVVKDYPEHLEQMSPGAVVRMWGVEDQPPPSTGPIPLPPTTDTTPGAPA
jgi:crossover junction endodeoxyribonuclease RusA